MTGKILKTKKIVTKILVYSIAFFYVPTIIIGIIFANFIRLEEQDTNTRIIENSVSLFERIIYEKNIEAYSITKYFAYDREIFDKLETLDFKTLSIYIEKLKVEHKLDDLIIYDDNCNIIAPIGFSLVNSQKLICPDRASNKIIFNENIINFDTVIPLDIKQRTYFIYSTYTLKKEYLKTVFVADINFIIINKLSNSSVFSTIDSEKIKSIKMIDKSYIKIFDFGILPKMKDYYIKVMIDPTLYRLRLDKIRYLIFTMLFLWILTTVLFFLILNRHLVYPIKKLLRGAENISDGKYDYRIHLETNNELGLLAEKFNEMSESLYKNNEFLKSINKELENKVVQRTKSLQQALDKLRDYDNQKTDLFYSIVHDLKNPLTVINGYATMVIQYDNFPIDKKKEFMRKIVAESERLTRMLNEFLKTIREESNLSKMEFGDIDILPILEYFYTIYEVQAKEMMVDFVWDVQSPMPLVKANKEKLEHVISNLLSNAFKFVNERGMIKISSRVDNGFIRIGISDTGPGIEDGKEKLIFEKFKKIENNERNQSGSGLGLYIAQQIISRHNGEIWVQNNTGGSGCTFYFTLPISE